MSSTNYPKNGFRPNPPLIKSAEATQTQDVLTGTPTEIARKRMSAILEGTTPVNDTRTTTAVNTVNINGGERISSERISTDRTGLDWSATSSTNGTKEIDSPFKEQSQHPAFQAVYRQNLSRPNGNTHSPQPVTTAPPVVSPASTTEPSEPQANFDTITIRGRADGISIEIGEGRWPDMMILLSERLTQSGAFFRGGQVALNVGTRQLSEADIHQVQAALERYNMSLGVIRSTSDLTAHVALAMGIAVSIESSDPAHDVHARHAGSNDELLSYFVYRGNLRSGQVLKMEETILIVGDVNPGAEVISAGDIFVWGRLRGIAHAGATGDAYSIVAALDLDPVQLRIAGEFSVSPEAQRQTMVDRFFRKRTLVKHPELARIAQGQIIVEIWNETSVPGGFSIFRR